MDITYLRDKWLGPRTDATYLRDKLLECLKSSNTNVEKLRFYLKEYGKTGLSLPVNFKLDDLKLHEIRKSSVIFSDAYYRIYGDNRGASFRNVERGDGFHMPPGLDEKLIPGFTTMSFPPVSENGRFIKLAKFAVENYNENNLGAKIHGSINFLSVINVTTQVCAGFKLNITFKAKHVETGKERDYEAIVWERLQHQKPDIVDAFRCCSEKTWFWEGYIRKNRRSLSKPFLVVEPVSSKPTWFPSRPGRGNLGERCMVKANHFLVELSGKDLHQYDVTITPEVTSRCVNRAVMTQLVKLYKESHLGNRLPAYDEERGNLKL